MYSSICQIPRLTIAFLSHEWRWNCAENCWVKVHNHAAISWCKLWNYQIRFLWISIIQYPTHSNSAQFIQINVAWDYTLHLRPWPASDHDQWFHSIRQLPESRLIEKQNLALQNLAVAYELELQTTWLYHLLYVTGDNTGMNCTMVWGLAKTSPRPTIQHYAATSAEWTDSRYVFPSRKKIETSRP